MLREAIESVAVELGARVGDQVRYCSILSTLLSSL